MGPQEDYIETVFTCEGDYDDPHLQDRLDDFQSRLKDLLLTDKNKLILKKVEPWNSVRVTFNIPREAALHLKQLAQQGNTTLLELGVLAVQIQDQHISLTIAGRNNERTQLVFKTSDSQSSSSAPLSVFDSNSVLDVLEAPSSGASNVEATRKNIADYLRQGALQDTLFGRLEPGSDRFRLPNVASTMTDASFKPNNVIPSSSAGHTPGLHGPFQQLPHTGPGPGFQGSPGANFNAVSPTRSPVGQAGLKFPSQPAIPPGLSPGLGQHPLAGLPPPPPYPGHGGSNPLLNNLQKSLRDGTTGTSPLLVNLLKNDPAMAGWLGKFPQAAEALSPAETQPPPKKKRKPRKPKEGKVKKQSTGNPDGEIPIQSVPNPALSPACSTGSETVNSTPPVTGIPTVTQSLPASHSSPVVGVPVSQGTADHHHKHPDHHPPVHNASIVSVNEEKKLPLTSPSTLLKRSDQESALFAGENTAGKIINPYTGLLEPMENLSDTSPVKSDSGDKVSPKAVFQKGQSPADVISDMISAHIRTDQTSEMAGTAPIGQGHNRPNHQRPLSGHPDSCSANIVPDPVSVSHRDSLQSFQHKSLDSSHLTKYPVGEHMQKNWFHENFGSDLFHKTTLSDKRSTTSTTATVGPAFVSEVKTSVSLPSVKVSDTPAELKHGNRSSSTSVGPSSVSSVEKSVPQDSDVKSIPSHLLNKPLLQVKHNHLGSKPSGSPDSNGDSENSSHSMTPEASAGTEAASSQAGAALDPNPSSDSGVGSSSERSDDTPSEPGDSDFKAGHANSFECAKTQIPVLDPLKQTTPNAKVMTVGYAMADIPKDMKNHKELHVPPFIGTNKFNSKLHSDASKVNLENSCLSNQATSVHWPMKEPHQLVNHADVAMSRVDTSNRRSPKLVPSPRPSTKHAVGGAQESQANSMQGNPDQTMHKNKKSPRNSPRGSPRNSPRASPRTSEPPGHGPARQTYISSGQDYAASGPVRSDAGKPAYSHMAPGSGIGLMGLKSGMVGPHLPAELEGRRDFSHSSVGVEGAAAQCNMDSAAFLKSLEAYPHAHLSQLAASWKMRAAFDPNILEKLGPIFQHFQHHVQESQPHLTVPSPNNGSDVKNRASPRSPNGNIPKSLANVSDLQNSTGSEASFTMTASPGVSGADLVNSTERDSVMSNCVGSRSTSSKSPVSSVSEGQKGTNVSTYSRRPSSAGALTNNPAFSLSESHLPPPKRLTESVQKLMVPFLDTTLPHPNRRSPCSSASSASSKTGSATSPQRVTSKGAGNKTPPISDVSAQSMASLPPLDLDLITPSITGFSFDRTDIGSVTSQKAYTHSRDSEVLPLPVTAPVTCAYLSRLPQCVAGGSAASTKTVPAVTGSILSPRTYTGDMSNAFNSAHCLEEASHTPAASSTVAGSGPSAEAFTREVTALCNSDNKMAVSSAGDLHMASAETNIGSSTSMSFGSIPERTQALFPPQNARYPVHKSTEKPKSPFSQMGLSEMLQETANLHSIAAERMSPHSQASSPRGLHHVGQQHHTVSNFDAIKSVADRKLELALESHLKETFHETKTCVSSSNSPGFASEDWRALPTRAGSGDTARTSSADGTGIPGELHSQHLLQRQLSESSSSAKIAHSSSVNTPGSAALTTGQRRSELSTASVFNDSVVATQTVRPNVLMGDSVKQSTALNHESVLSWSSDGGSVKAETSTNCDNTDKASQRSGDGNSRVTGAPTCPTLQDSTSATPTTSDSVVTTLTEGESVTTSQGSSLQGYGGEVSISENTSMDQISVSGVSNDTGHLSKTESTAAVNCVGGDCHTEGEGQDSDLLNSSADNQELHQLRSARRLNKMSRGINDENSEDCVSKSGSAEPDLAPRQLRSRKRNNTSESENSNSADDPQAKKMKVEHVEGSVKAEGGKDMKGAVVGSVKTAGQVFANATSEGKVTDPAVKGGDQNASAPGDTVKTGLRARTQSRNVLPDEKPKREIRKDGKALFGKVGIEKKLDQNKVLEDPKRTQQSRRNRQSPSAPLDKPVNSTGSREKSPIRGSRTRGRNSPSVVEQQEETQENKRTTRSARSKADTAVPESASLNKRRRSSRDHK